MYYIKYNDTFDCVLNKPQHVLNKKWIKRKELGTDFKTKMSIDTKRFHNKYNGIFIIN